MNADPNHPPIAPDEPSARVEEDPRIRGKVPDTCMRHNALINQSQPSLRRQLCRAAVISFLCAGLTTVVLAQVLVNASPCKSSSRGAIWCDSPNSKVYLTDHLGSGFGIDHFGSVELVGSPTPAKNARPSIWVIDVVRPPDPDDFRYAYCVGIPWPSLWSGESAVRDGTSSRALPFRQIKIGPVILATGILWPGLLADTAFFATLWFGILLAPNLIRRARRRRRGQCTTCGYNLAATPTASPCPECGQSCRG